MQTSNAQELLTFYLNESLCGVDVARVEEINRPQEATPVPQAPDYILGLVNLRGKIVTIMDLGIRVGLDPTAITPNSRAIIVRSGGELLGLIVDRVTEVVPVTPAAISPTPNNLQGPPSRFFTSVMQVDHGLVGILNLDEVLDSNTTSITGNHCS